MNLISSHPQQKHLPNLKPYPTSIQLKHILNHFMFYFYLWTPPYPASRPAHVKAYSWRRPSFESRDEVYLTWRVVPGSQGARLQFPDTSFNPKLEPYLDSLTS